MSELSTCQIPAQRRFQRSLLPLQQPHLADQPEDAMLPWQGSRVALCLNNYKRLMHIDSSIVSAVSVLLIA